LKILVLLNRSIEALAHARLRSDAEQRFQALEIIYRTLKAKNQPNHRLIDEMLVVVTEIKTPFARHRAQSILEKLHNSEELSSNCEKPETLSQKSSKELAGGSWLDQLVTFSAEERKQLQQSADFFIAVSNLIEEKRYEDVETLIFQVSNSYFQAYS
jgi:leucyl-tRNA synthetase